jgi:hypothetical protein
MIYLLRDSTGQNWNKKFRTILKKEKLEFVSVFGQVKQYS